jgi:hypothetical protein
MDNPINLNECHLVLHTLISDNYKNISTYFKSYTKPFMIELVNNATQDCMVFAVLTKKNFKRLMKCQYFVVNSIKN